MSETFTCRHCGESTDDVIRGRVHQGACLAFTQLQAEIDAGERQHGQSISIKELVDRVDILATADVLLREGHTYPDVFTLLREAGVDDLDIEAAALVMEDWKKR